MAKNLANAETVDLDLSKPLEEQDIDDDFSQISADFLEHEPPIILENYIGKGSYGYVIKGIAQYDNLREVAVKIMKPLLLMTRDQMDLKDLKKRFMNECVLQYALAQQEDKIVKVFDYGEFLDHRFMVMELMSDKSLRHIIEEYRNYALQDRVSIMIDIADILKSIHSRGFVHRDIKPENSLFSKGTYIIQDHKKKKFTGERIIKLTDFGLMRWIHHSPFEENRIIGSPDYMSPEQVNDPENVDKRTDIFSFGVVFYELLNGKYPRQIDENNVSNKVQYILTLVNTPARDMADINPTVKDLNDIVMKCMRLDPSKRYQSMDQVSSELRDYYNEKFVA